MGQDTVGTMEETVAGTAAFKSKLTFQIQHEVFR